MRHLAALTDVSQPTVSHHLKVLRDVGVLASERRGTWVWYRITPGYKAAVTTLLDSFAPAALEASVTQEVLRGLEDVDPADFARVLEVNLGGTFHCTQAFGQAMLAAGRGCIVNVVSIAAAAANPSVGAYSASIMRNCWRTCS